MMKPKVIIFDFDGVITKHGEFAKELAWDELASEYLEPEEKLIQEKLAGILKQKRELYGQGRAKGDRHDILRETFVDLGYEKSKAEEKTQFYAKRYNDLVQRLILEGGLSEGATEALERLYKIVPLYINSATPEDGVRESAKALGIEKYFVAIYGRPRTKEENLGFIMATKNLAPEKVLFVGDGSGDEKAAQEVGCQFIGFSNAWNKWENKSFPLVYKLGELVSYL